MLVAVQTPTPSPPPRPPRVAAPPRSCRRSAPACCRGMAEAMMEKGYVDTTVADVIKRAGVSRETFYQQFSSKADCFMTAFDAAADLLIACVEAGADLDIDALGARRRAGDPRPASPSSTRALTALPRHARPAPRGGPPVPRRGLRGRARGHPPTRRGATADRRRWWRRSWASPLTTSRAASPARCSSPPWAAWSPSRWCRPTRARSATCANRSSPWCAGPHPRDVEVRPDGTAERSSPERLAMAARPGGRSVQ